MTMGSYYNIVTYGNLRSKMLIQSSPPTAMYGLYSARVAKTYILAQRNILCTNKSDIATKTQQIVTLAQLSSQESSIA